jgi:hypothetical protein
LIFPCEAAQTSACTLTPTPPPTNYTQTSCTTTAG